MQSELEQLADSINTLAAFCGRRDINVLDQYNLQKTYGIDQADILIMFGASIPAAYSQFLFAWKQNITKHYCLTGGIGHTTATLQELMKDELQTDTSNMPEAEVMKTYLSKYIPVDSILIENKSTNCGNNVTNTLELLEDKNIPHNSIIIMQDATMQLRMDAGFRKFASNSKIINFAGYQAHVIARNNRLEYDTNLWGMWDIDRFVNLLLGEIHRLRDDQDGYGPNGLNYIAHVDIPENVNNAYQYILRHKSTASVRDANELYKS